MMRQICLFFFLLIGLLSYGQDIHFSQYFLSPLSYNPANTGDINEDFRVAGNFRTQWRAIDKPYQSTGVSFDQQTIFKNRLFNVGAYFVNDQSGDGRLNINKFLLSGGYNHSFMGVNWSGGIQAGLVSKSLSKDNLTFPDQFNMATGTFDPSLATGDQNLLANLNFLDVNLGFSAAKKVTEKLFAKAHVGLFHVNYPKESFLNEINRLPMRTMWSTQGVYQLPTKSKVALNILSMYHAKAKESVWNAMYLVPVNPDKMKVKEVFGGLSYRDGLVRNNDSFILNIGSVYKNYTIGVSYDVNVSDLRASTKMRGALEIAIIYKSLNSLTFGKGLPCERF